MLPDIGPTFALAQQQGHLGGVGIIGVHMDDPDALAGPFGIEARRHLGLRGLAAAMVGDQAYGSEPAGFEAARDPLDHGCVDRLRHPDRAGEPHVAGRRIVIPFRHIGDHRRHQRMAELGRNAPRRVANDMVMLAQDHVGAVLLDPAGRHDHRRIAVIERRAHLDPGHVGEIDRVGQRRRERPIDERQRNGEARQDAYDELAGRKITHVIAIRAKSSSQVAIRRVPRTRPVQ